MCPLKLPKLDDPKCYEGLYIFDFGQAVSVGYTAAEIDILLQEDRYRSGKVYRIYRAHDDGRLEIVGVDKDVACRQSGMVFRFDTIRSARQAFDRLRQVARQANPPCDCQVQLARYGDLHLPYCVAMIYPAQFEDQVGRWMLEIDFRAGQQVQGGAAVIAIYRLTAKVQDSFELTGPVDRISRSKQQVLESVNLPVQR